MSRLMPLCFACKHLQDSKYNEAKDDTTYYCDAYPDGIPEAVIDSGHLYPKPGDNGIRFEMKGDMPDNLADYLSDYLEQSQEEEDENYRGYAEYYEEVNMSDAEFADKMKREHGDDWYLYTKPERMM